ncbi:hypothetical protein GCM10010196_14760 [Agromyces mediolanus]|uniref:Uncharacterized protein n=1 Tax=Agromyces mediolanus TaxID=41986 RepID=A0A918CI01_AGRME|nr:hypothetical protein GCM10010196_14760 [Agromyces mediolanus]GLJ73922.1 hypothetical protein GCM10017583_31810 [Agromyces mediolanus]
MVRLGGGRRCGGDRDHGRGRAEGGERVEQSASCHGILIDRNGRWVIRRRRAAAAAAMGDVPQEASKAGGVWKDS